MARLNIPADFPQRSSLNFLETRGKIFIFRKLCFYVLFFESKYGKALVW